MNNLITNFLFIDGKLIKMPAESIIWQIGLFKKISATECECLECKKLIKLSYGSTTSATNHLKTKHKGTEYEQKFMELQKRRDGEAGSMTKHVSITSSGGL